MTQPTQCPTCAATLDPSGFDIGEVLFCLHCHAECVVLAGHQLGPNQDGVAGERTGANPYAAADSESMLDPASHSDETSNSPFAPPKGSIQVSMEPNLRTFPPPGILVVAVFDLLLGIVLSGVVLLFMTVTGVAGGFFTVIGLTIGGCFLASCLGLLRGMPWARLTQFVLNGIGLVICALFAAGTAHLGELGHAPRFWVIVLGLMNVLPIVLLSTLTSREWFQNVGHRERDRLRSRRRSRFR